jgi:hypothetical protein
MSRKHLKHRLADGQVFQGPDGRTMGLEDRNGDGRVVMKSPRTGEHTLDFKASSPSRIAAHWRTFTMPED